MKRFLNQAKVYRLPKDGGTWSTGKDGANFLGHAARDARSHLTRVQVQMCFQPPTPVPVILSKHIPPDSPGEISCTTLFRLLLKR
jgi:hypothetical protein